MDELGDAIPFGFLTNELCHQLRAPDYRVRESATTSLVATIRSTSSENIQVEPLLSYINPLLRDPNMSVVQNTYTAIKYLIENLDQTSALYLHTLIQMSLNTFSDSRKFVTQFGNSLLNQLIKILPPSSVLTEILKAMSTAPAQVISQIFDFLDSLVTFNKIPTVLLTQFTFILDDCVGSPHSNIQKSSNQFLTSLKFRDSTTYQIIVGSMKPEAIEAHQAFIKPQNPNRASLNVVAARPTSVKSVLSSTGRLLVARTPGPQLLTQFPRPPSRSSQMPPHPPNSIPITNINATNLDTITEEKLTNRQIEKSDTDARFSSHSIPRVIDIKDAPDDFTKIVDSPPTPPVAEFYPNDDDDVKPQSTRLSVPAAEYTLPDDPDAYYDGAGNSGYRVPQRQIDEDEDPYEFAPVSRSSFSRSLNFKKPYSAVVPAKQPLAMQTKQKPTTTTKVSDFAQTAPLPSKIIGDRVLAETEMEKVPSRAAFSKATRPRVRSNMVTIAAPKERASPKVHKSSGHRFAELFAKLQSDEWSDQNDAILDMQAALEDLQPQISRSAREITAILADCGGSLRTALAKNALSLLLVLIRDPRVDCTANAEQVCATLLGVVSSGRQFISAIAGDCLSAMVDAMPASRACSILVNESRRKQDKARIRIAVCMSNIAAECAGNAEFTKCLDRLCEDANQEVRRMARLAKGKM